VLHRAMTEFRILGPLEVVDDEGVVVDLGGPRQRALLAALLVRANTVVSSERLIDELWGENVPKTAATSLHNAVHQLRRLLGTETLVRRAPGYVLRVEEAQLDAARFERMVAEARDAELEERAGRLREALALWRGEPLEGLAFEGSAAGEARRLEELRIGVLEERIDAELAAGRHTAVIGELEGLVAEHPLRERLRGLLMLALYRSGRQAEALQVYHEARRVLVEELGIEPGRELKELYMAIIRQERSLERVSSRVTAADHFGEALQALLAGRLVPVLGPAVHRPAEANGIPAVPPGLAAAAAHLARAFDCPPDQALTRVSQYVSVTRGVGPLYDELHALFGRPYPPGPIHHTLASLPPLLRERGLPQQLIVTTGYDHTVERAFAAAEEPLEVVSYIALGRDRGKFVHLASDGSARVIHEPNVDVALTNELTVLLKIHGGADESDARDRESFVVSEDDYIDYLAHTPLSTVLPVGLAARLRRSHLLFLGYDLEDWSLRVFLRRLWGDERIAYRSWAVGPAQDALSVEYWRQRGVEAFDVPLEEYVAELAARIETAPAGRVVA
jgi:DNA-binding SARP family transcriptional activator